MDRPQYVNAFSVTYNPDLKETVIQYSHQYPVIAVTPPEEATGKPKVQAGMERSDVCSVVLPEKVARQLIEVLAKSMPTEQNYG